MNFTMLEKVLEENKAVVVHWMIPQVLGVPSIL